MIFSLSFLVHLVSMGSTLQYISRRGNTWWEEPHSHRTFTLSMDIQNAREGKGWLWKKHRDGDLGQNYAVWLNRDWREYPNAVLDAFRELELRTCLYFGENRSTGDRVEFTFEGDDCGSEEVGRKGGLQNINLGKGCIENIGLILRQILHAVGFFREHQRRDRDQHIKIQWQNIAKENKKHFNKFKGKVVTRYDRLSVLHGDPYYLSENGKPSMTDLNDGEIEMGRTESLSDLDIVKINEIYPCCKDAGAYLGYYCSHVADQCDDTEVKEMCKKTCGVC